MGGEGSAMDRRKPQAGPFWGEVWLDGGETIIMNPILKHYRKAGVTNLEMLLLIQLSSDCSTHDEVSERMGLTVAAIKGMLGELHMKGVIEISHPPGEPILYDAGLFSKRIERMEELVTPKEKGNE